MKKVIKTLALCTVLGVTAVSCQKEPVASTQNTETKAEAMYVVNYAVDGTLYTVSLYSENEMDALFLQLTALARQGSRVVVLDENARARTMSSKEVLTYTTTSETDAANWANEKTKEGYEVTIVYNDRTGIYTCTAVK